MLLGAGLFALLWMLYVYNCCVFGSLFVVVVVVFVVPVVVDVVIARDGGYVDLNLFLTVITRLRLFQLLAGSIQGSHRPISFTRIKHRTRANDNLCK